MKFPFSPLNYFLTKERKRKESVIRVGSSSGESRTSTKDKRVSIEILNINL